MNTSLPTAEHFLLEAVADGIYAAIATPGKGTQGNTAIRMSGCVSWSR